VITEPVHILVTCRKPELLPAATLVFRTLRVGFPEAPVTVHLRFGQTNRLEIQHLVGMVKAKWIVTFIEAHDQWIEKLITNSAEPFWICDTDVVFWREFEHVPDGSALAGVRVPSFFEPWTGTQYRERLHTCLMRIDPEAFRSSILVFSRQFARHPFQPHQWFIPQQLQSERHNGTVTQHFYDTLAMAWHAFGGQEFTPAQIESFSHLNCATYADLIAPSVDFDMLGAHKAVYEDIENARGLWAKQFKWFAQHKVKVK
jgi:hypothetical protein